MGNSPAFGFCVSMFQNAVCSVFVGDILSAYEDGTGYQPTKMEQDISLRRWNRISAYEDGTGYQPMKVEQDISL